MDGLCNVNVELTDRCNKNCWMCGRRKREKENPNVKYGDMDFNLVEDIAGQLPDGIIVQLHNNGEPLLYPQFGDAVITFHRQITSITTNGKLLLEKAGEIINNLDTLAVSIIEKDSEALEQYEILTEFLKLKGNKKPLVILRMVGNVNKQIKDHYEKLGLLATSRLLHSPDGSFEYEAKPTIPEIGICLEVLHRLAIDRKGNVSICVRYDPKDLGVIGNANRQLLADIWNGNKRAKWLEYHRQGQRNKIPLCSYCDYWGVPIGKVKG